jgi:hypothetical protein
MSRSIVALATALLVLSALPAVAATPIGEGGTPGKAVFGDTRADPGARCQYKPISGGYALGHVNVYGIEVFGNLGDQRQTVGTRVWLQHREDGTWVRRVKGELLTGRATAGVPVTLDPNLLYVPGGPGREGLWRAAVKVIWYAPDRSVRGWRTYVIDQYRTLVKGSNGPVRTVRQVCLGSFVMVD